LFIVEPASSKGKARIVDKKIVDNDDPELTGQEPELRRCNEETRRIGRGGRVRDSANDFTKHASEIGGVRIVNLN